jgi:DNA helicase-2/ATP-dependent DNA helicase PcrA
MEPAQLKNQLNPPQFEAVTQVEGPLLVLAGAGSGKTRVITYRIAYMVGQAGVSPHSILAVTFTNKAAREMKNRVETLVGGNKDIWVSTFHSSCARILRRHAEALGYPRDFTIYDDDDSKALIKKTLLEMNVTEERLSILELRAYIDRAKNRGLDPEAASQSEPEPLKAEGYALYQRKLKGSGAMDFGDLILNVVSLWKRDRRVLEEWKRRFGYILVDEFQDTNRVQLEFLTLLAGGKKNLCAVGDDDQSIYRWRGAEVANILSFEKLFTGAKTIRLEQNYRSTKAILDAANSVVSRNTGRHPKKLWTDRVGGSKVTIYGARDDRAEASYVAGVMSKERLLHKASLDTFAVFVRTGAQTRAFEERFRELRIPYELVGGVRFYERKEIKDVLSYLRLSINPRSDVDFERIVNLPARGIGQATIEKLRAAAGKAGSSMLEAATGAGGKLSGFVGLIARLAEKAKTARASELAREVLEATGYEAMLKVSRDPGDADRLENIEELITGMEEFEETAGEGDNTIAAFLEKAALTAEVDRFEDGDGKVTLMTLHSAKGLEFKNVFITGCEEGLLPHSRSLDDPEELEEERRLMYVGMTRAMETLKVTYAFRRRWQGNYRDQLPSRFIREIPGTDWIKEESPEQQWENSERTGFYGWQGGRSQAFDRGDGTSIDYSETQHFGGYSQDRHPDRKGGDSGRRIIVRDDDQPHGKPAGKSVWAPPGAPGGGRHAHVGKMVRHELFGIGVVKGVDQDGDSLKLWIQFPGVGLKKVLEKYVQWVK